MRHELIQGSGGGKGSSGSSYRSPVESPNTLQSVQYVTLIDVVSEGPIEGLYDSDKSIYINELPLRTAGGSLTLQDVSWKLRTGTPDQTSLPYDSGAETEVGVSTEVTNLYPKGEGPDSGLFQFSVTNSLVTRLRLTLGVQALYEVLTDQDQDHAGDTVPTSLGYRIVITDVNGTVIKDYSNTITGKTTSQYLWDLLFDLSGTAPWIVSVYKTTADSSTSSLFTDLYISSYTEIVGYSFIYPSTAMVAVTASAETFSGSIPSRSYRVKGLKVKVPSNYNPLTRAYSGTWDGTFQTAWTDNPAWVFYDMVTNDRYGLAKFLPQAFLEDHDLCDKWFLYNIAQLCDTLVPDGFGGSEPRFTFNGQIMGSGEAKEVLQSIASVFHGMTYWSSGLIYARTDYPEDPIRTITQANVIDGLFTYSSGSMQEQHSVALVTWYDPDDMGRAHIEAVYDWDKYKKLGYRPVDSVAYGCYSRGQANRHGLWLLASEDDQWIVSFEMGLDGFDLLPGDIVKIADPSWMGYRASGRVVSISGTTITLDAEFETSPREVYQLSICDDDGTEETQSVTAVDGNEVTVSSAFTHGFVDHALWSMSGTLAEPRQFRVQNIKETDKATIQVELLEFNPNKYVEIEQGLTLEEPPSRRPLKTAVTAPENLNVMESTATVNAQLVQKALFSWGYTEARFDITSYRISYTDAIGNVHNTDWSNNSCYELTNVIGGTWTFKVQARTFDGRVSPWATLTYQMAGISALSPVNVSSMGLEEWGYLQRDGVHISNVNVTWTAPSMTAASIGGYEIWYRYSTAAAWQLYGIADASENMYTIENALTNKTIYVMVKTRSVLNVVSSGVSSSLAIVGKDALPTAPANFTVTQNSYDRTQLLLSWGAVNEVDLAGYRVYLDGVIAVNGTADTSAVVTLTRGGQHTLRLVSVDNSRQESAAVTVTGTYSIIPEDVTGLAVSQSDYERTVINLSWNAVAGNDIEYYEVREGVSWSDGTVVIARAANINTELHISTEGTFTYWVAAHTVGGYISQTPQSVSGTFDLNPTAPTNFTAVQDSFDSTRLVISWTASTDLDVVSYEVRDGISWTTAAVLGVTSDSRLTVTVHNSHDYVLMLRAKNKAGFESDTAYTSCDITLEPSDVAGFQAVQDGGAVDLLWDKNPESDIAGYEIREGFTWASASVVAAGVTQLTFSVNVSIERTYRYMVKAINRAGYYSYQPASAILAVDDLPPKNVLLTWDDIALQDGSHDNSRFADNPSTWANTPGVFADYSTTRWVDMGTALVLTLAAGATSGVWTSPVRDAARLISAHISLDFMTLSRIGTSAVLEFRTSQDGETWTSWKILQPHQETLRYLQYRVVMTADSAELQPCVTVLKIIVDMPDVVKAGRLAVTATGGAGITYGFEYAVAPVVVVTADGADKRAVLVGAPGTASCTVKILNSSGDETTGIVNWNAYGY